MRLLAMPGPQCPARNTGLAILACNADSQCRTATPGSNTGLQSWKVIKRFNTDRSTSDECPIL